MVLQKTQPTQAATEVVGLIRQDCTGYSNCYTSLSSWEAAYGGINFGSCTQGNLVCADKIAVAQIDGAWTSPDTTPVTIAGWTTGPSNYIRIYTTATARHDGKWNTSKYRLELSGVSLSLDIQEDYVRIEGLQVYNGGYPDGTAINIRYQAATSDVRVSYSIVRGDSNTLYAKYGIIMTSVGTLKAWNNIIYDFTRGFSSGIFLSNTSGVGYIYNNTIYNLYYGIRDSGGSTIRAKNNLVQSSSNNAYYGIFNTSSNYNLSDDSTSTSGANDKTSQTVSFVDVSNKDFHLQSSDIAAQNYGTNLSGDANLSFSDDIDGQTRSGVWDIGADEVSGITPSPYCGDGSCNGTETCSTCSQDCGSCPPPDTTPPVRSNGSPTGTLSAGTTSTTLSLTTNENATCKYSTTAGVSYASMPNTFSSTGGTSHSTTVSGLTNGATYNHYIKCQDTSGNANTDDYLVTFSVASLVPDTTPPSTPTGLIATAVSSSQINLSWTASTDNVGVTGYRLERCQGSTCTNFFQIATPTGTSYSDTGLSANTTYRYRVRAVDAAGNLSSYSSIASATTQAAPTVSAGAPVLYFSDLTDGPIAGWEGSATKGAAVSIWGNNFGSLRGTSYVTVGGVNLTNDSDYAEWGVVNNPPPDYDGKTGYVSARGLERITFWLKSNMQTGPGTIKVTTADGESNEIPFYCRNTGNIYFISRSGSDGNNGRYSTNQGGTNGPWFLASKVRTLQAGDAAYFREGVWDEEDSWSAVIGFVNTNHNNGIENKSISVASYPGEIAQLGSPSIRLVFRHFGNTPGDILNYWTFSKFIMRGSGGILACGSGSVHAGSSDHFRIVGIDSSTYSTGAIGWEFDGQAGGMNYLSFYGNYVHDTGVDYRGGPYTLTSRAYGFYLEGYGTFNHTDVGWNEVAYDSRGRVQFYGHLGASDWIDNLYFHDNYVHHMGLHGVILGGGDTGGGGEYTFLRNAYFYNNIIAFNGQRYPETGGKGILMGGEASGGNGGNWYVYNNLFYKNLGGEIYVSPGSSPESIVMKNNIIVPTSGQSYYSGLTGSFYSGSNNLYYGAGNGPSWDTSRLDNINPQFVVDSPISYADFHLKETSPAIDKGTSDVSYLVKEDFEKNLRPMDGNKNGTAEYDIGAYEYTGLYIPPPAPYCGDGSCNGTETCSTCPLDCGSCPPSDTTPPSTPTNLAATAVSSAQINLSWAASTDNVGVAGYRIYRGGSQIATTTNTTYQNTGLSPSTTYTYTVAAYDVSGNVSTQSASASATTQLPPDTTPPVISNVSISNLTQTSATITWQTDEPATSQVEYGQTISYGLTTILDSSLVSFHSQNLPNLSANTTYHYRVTSKDSSNNQTVSSDQTFITKTATQPTLIVALTAQPNSGTSSLSNVSLTVQVSGTVQGNINYTFYCNREDTGTNITTPYQVKYDNLSDTTKTAQNLCNYTKADTYIAKVIVERGGLTSQAQTEIKVSEPPTPTTPTTPATPPGGGTTPTTPTTPATPATPTSPTAPTLPEKPLSEMSIAELQAKITEILALINNLKAQISQLQKAQITEIPANYRFTKTLQYGQTSEDVKYLQIFLKSQGTEIYPEGLVTSYFGPKTKSAVIRFQEKYSQEILKPFGLIRGTGIVGEKTRAKINQVLGR